MKRISHIGPGEARTEEFQKMFRAIASAPPKCSECVAYHAEGNTSVPCKGDFPEHCEYNNTEEEEEGETE